MRQGKIVLTDGPFAEKKEQFGGYHLGECRDRDEAIGIEVCPVTVPEHDNAVR